MNNTFYDYSFSFVLNDLFSYKNRKLNYSIWENSPKEIARHKFGILYTDDTPNRGLREVYLKEIYSKFYEFIPSNHDVVIDAGAQFGDFALLCAKGYGVKQVYAFEPVKSNYSILKSNIELNNAANVKCDRSALGAKNTEIEIFYENDMANSFGYGSPESVPLKTLDSLNLGRVNFMKIDVEGFEMDFLNGAKNTLEMYHPKIIIETHSKKLETEVKAFLTDLGYRLFHTIKNSAPKDRPEMDSVKNLFFLPFNL